MRANYFCARVFQIYIYSNVTSFQFIFHYYISYLFDFNVLPIRQIGNVTFKVSIKMIKIVTRAYVKI